LTDSSPWNNKGPTGSDAVSARSGGIWNPQTMSDKLVAPSEDMPGAHENAGNAERRQGVAASPNWRRLELQRD